MLAFRTILCPTDFSEHSRYAFQLACSLARDHGARVVVLYVDPPPVAYGEAIARRQDSSYCTYLWQTLEDFQSPDAAVPVERRLEEGDPASTILSVARQLSADLIVLGTHGRTGLRRLLMGSVAEAVVRRAKCPVFTFKEPHNEPATAAPASAGTR